MDVALLWPPEAQGLAGYATFHRPPTRLYYWWSLGVPVLSYPMPAYIEAGRRAGYPAELLHLRSAAEVQSALCAVRQPGVRKCLRRIALDGAKQSSPQASAFGLLRAACEIAKMKAATATAST